MKKTQEDAFVKLQIQFLITFIIPMHRNTQI